MSGRIYLDNAATSWPKPPGMVEAIASAITDNGAAAGRGAYSHGMHADQIVMNCRRELASMIGCRSDEVLLATSGTHALNIAIQGYLRSGDHVVTTQIEHNSVLRPLAWLQRTRDVSVSIVPCNHFGFVDPAAIEDAIQGNTRLVAVSHASNVTGAVQDIATIGAIARQRNVRLLVDAAQSLGHLPIDVRTMSIDMLASSGHKGCLGPLGTGMLYINDSIQPLVDPLIFGGTGTHSDQPEMPLEFPARHEAGNLNVPAIAGWLHSVRWLKRGNEDDKSIQLAERLTSGLASIPTVGVFRDPNRLHLPVVGITIDAWQPTDAASVLDAQFGIQVRAGLHCSPLMRKALKSESGTLRFSLSRFTHSDEIDAVIAAIEQMASVEHA